MFFRFTLKSFLFFTALVCTASIQISVGAPLCPSNANTELLQQIFSKPGGKLRLDQRQHSLNALALDFSSHKKMWEIDDALQMGARYLSGDPHAVMLEKLGATVVRDGDRVKMNPPDFKTFITRYHEEIEKLIKSGKLQERDVISPAIPFLDQETDEYIFVRPGIDPPPGEGLVQVKQDFELDFASWTKAISEGKSIFQFGMANHDFAHLTEYLGDPQKMKEVRELYRKLNSGELKAVEPEDLSFLVKKKFDIFSRFKKDKLESEKKLQVRIFFADEVLSLPDLAKASAIHEKMPYLFDESFRRNLRAHRLQLTELSRIDLPGFQKRLEVITKESDTFLLRIGGGIRDTYNLGRYGDIRLRWGEIFKKNFGHAVYFSDHPIPRPFEESLHARIKVLRELSRDFSDQSFKFAKLDKWNVFRVSETTARSSVLAYMAHELAAIELSIREGIELKLTPSKIIRESAVQNISKGSDTYKYFNATTEENSLARWGFSP